MYRSLVLIVLAFLFSLHSFAQLKGGVKGGLNVTDLIITNGTDYFGDATFETKATYHFGSYVQNTFSKHFGYQIEMLFSNKGYRLKTDSLTTSLSLNYLNWPVLLVYKLGDRLVFNAGLELGLMVTGEDIFNTFDLGLDIGAEFYISKKIMAGLRYNHGFPFSMNLDAIDYSGSEPRYQHSVLQVYIGFNIVNEPASE